MNKKNRIYLIILIVLAVIFVLTKLDTKKEKRFNFFAADSNSVARIEITLEADTLYLAKEGSDWKIVYPVKWDMQVGKMDKIFDTVLTAETSTLPISENEASLVKYSLTDSLATHLKTFDAKGNVLDDVLLGKSSSYSNTPVRKIGSNQVYRLESNIAYILKPVLGSWRKREIIEIDPEQITKIMVVSDDNNYALEMADSLWVYSDEKESFNVDNDNSTLTGIINSFKRFAASDFVDGKYEEYKSALEMPVVEVGIEMWSGDNFYFRYIPYEEKKYLLQFNNDTNTLYVQYESNMNKFQKQAVDFQ
ncbi:MAG: DUF4340 domain-containing protein [Candidatus Cloacimonetes bacterium]|nr:DUF4340 domain-containing protein [Candidatus Cloacimonadota bacterium]